MCKSIIKNFRIGDVFLVDFRGMGCEQHGRRPALVLQNNLGNKHSPNVIMLPLTSSIKKKGQATHVFIPAQDSGLMRDSVVLCENPETVSKDRVGAYLTTLSDKYMSEVAIASTLAIGALSFINKDELSGIWSKTAELNSQGK